MYQLLMKEINVLLVIWYKPKSQKPKRWNTMDILKSVRSI